MCRRFLPGYSPEKNYQADLFQILHESVFGDSKWDSPGTFLIFYLEPLVRGTPGGAPRFQ